ncbi:hypothetical protein ACFWBB_17675 [Streptomyces sp. NPDC060000]|uniref:hypothetical protein n=1 Tax=Streptomyces sp. NPDC060000 TaxID=3347031 RepID=UPI00368AF510
MPIQVGGQFGLEGEHLVRHRVELGAAFGGETCGLAFGGGEAFKCLRVELGSFRVCGFRCAGSLGQLPLEAGALGLDDLGDAVTFVRRKYVRGTGLGAGESGPAPLHQRSAPVLADAVDVHLAALGAVDVEDLAALAVGCLAPADAGEVGGCGDALGCEGPDQAAADAVHLACTEAAAVERALDGLTAQDGESLSFLVVPFAVEAVQPAGEGTLLARLLLVDALQCLATGGFRAAPVPRLAVQAAAVGELERAVLVEQTAEGTYRLDQAAAVRAYVREGGGWDGSESVPAGGRAVDQRGLTRRAGSV